MRVQHYLLSQWLKELVELAIACCEFMNFAKHISSRIGGISYPSHLINQHTRLPEHSENHVLQIDHVQ